MHNYQIIILYVSQCVVSHQDSAVWAGTPQIPDLGHCWTGKGVFFITITTHQLIFKQDMSLSSQLFQIIHVFVHC